jgi:hypothetical protein
MSTEFPQKNRGFRPFVAFRPEKTGEKRAPARQTPAGVLRERAVGAGAEGESRRGGEEGARMRGVQLDGCEARNVMRREDRPVRPAPVGANENSPAIHRWDCGRGAPLCGGEVRWMWEEGRRGAAPSTDVLGYFR